MDPVDLEILKRLEKLHEPVQQIPTDDELHARLQALKGVTTTPVTNKYVLLPKPQSNSEQVDNLMKQFANEVTLQDNHSKSRSVSEIEKRLQELKSDGRPKPASVQSQPRENDTKVLLEKILAEAALEKKTENQFPHLVPQFSKTREKVEKMEFSDSEEEFCTICDRCPKWMCLDCDKHMFCARCFNEYHEDIGEYHQKRSIVRRQRRRSTDSDEYSD